MGEKKKKSGLSWIEEILNEDSAPLEDIFKAKKNREEDNKEREKKGKKKPIPEGFVRGEGLSLDSILSEKTPETNMEKPLASKKTETKKVSPGHVILEEILGKRKTSKSLQGEKQKQKKEKKERGITSHYQEPSSVSLESILQKPEPIKSAPSLGEILGTAKREKGEVAYHTYSGEVKVLDVYGNVRVLKVKGEPVPIYELRIPKLSEDEKRLLKTVKERAISEIQIDPESIPDFETRRKVFLKAVRDMIKDINPHLSEGRIEFLSEYIVQNMIGYGRLDPLVRDDNLEEIMVIGTNKPVYVWHRRFNMCKTNIIFENEKEILNIIERIAREVGRRIDQQSPLLDARLPDGSRVNATIPPISLEGPTITIRKFKRDPLTIIDLIKYGTLNTDIAALLWIFVDGLGVKPANILVAGGTGSGKTTMLNSLAMFIPPSERVISIEDTAELQLPIEHWVRLETRPPNLEGKGEVTMDDLVKNTLRMRPDRIIVGEVRGPEARTMFTAMNTGHDGALLKEEPILLADGQLIKIGKFAERFFRKHAFKKEGEFEWVDVSNEKVYIKSFNKETFKIEDKLITRVWRRKYKGKMLKIKTKNGNGITLTPDHPIYKIENGIVEINSERAKIGDYIVLSRGMDMDGKDPAEALDSEKLKLLTDANVYWDRIVAIEEIEVDDYVYDLTVADNHTYIAGKCGGIIVSNCMGTIHSNSARETIVRLESPPMNVPRIMIPALDIIMMLVRFNSRKKGVIRRVTEIAEVSGIEGESIQLNKLYKYDPAKDELESTGVPSRFMTELAHHTGMSMAELELEKEKRKIILDWMIEKGIRDIEKVGHYIRQFYIDQETLLKRIEADTGGLSTADKVSDVL